MTGRASNPPDPAVRLAEIDATLLTRGPIALDFALLLAERKRLYEALFPDSRNGGDRKSLKFREKIRTTKLSFCSDAAEKLALSERDVQRTVALGEAFNPSEVQALRGSCIADNAAALRDFAERDAAVRAGLLALLAAGARSYKVALIESRLRVEVERQERLFQAFVPLWAAASAKTKRRILVHAGVAPDIARAVAAAADRRARRAPAMTAQED